MKSIKTIALLILVLSQGFISANAGEYLSDEECINVYRTGYIELTERVEAYNADQLNRAEFAGLVGLLSTDIGIHRASCLAAESPDAEICIAKYRTLYKKLRTRVDITAVIFGNQDRVSYTEQTFSVSKKEEEVEKTLLSGVKKWFSKAKNNVKKASQIGELAFIDLACQ